MDNDIDQSLDIDQIVINIQEIRTAIDTLTQILNDQTIYLKTMTELLTSIKDK